MADTKLTHFNASGEAHMVDISAKKETKREATALGVISISEEAFFHLKQEANKKGDVLGVARLAAIMGVKKTAELIPLCHPLSLTHIEVTFALKESHQQVEIAVRVGTTGKTGVEMEALTGASIGLLTIYDMLKSIDKTMVIHQIYVAKKSGGKSGDWEHQLP